MNSEKDQKLVQKPISALCVECLQMYGNPAFLNMCSMCFKTSQKNAQACKKLEKEQRIQSSNSINTQQQKKSNQTEDLKEKSDIKIRRDIVKESEKSERERTRQKQEKKPMNKCFTCSKKVGMLGFECSHCSSQFCKSHRLPEDHECTVDYISAGKKLLTMANPQIRTKKIVSMDK